MCRAGQRVAGVEATSQVLGQRRKRKRKKRKEERGVTDIVTQEENK